MKNKGFTLVELVAVVSLLGILLLFTYSKVSDISEKKNKELLESKKTLIINAVKDYMDTYSDLYPQMTGINFYISIETLDNENLISVDIKDVLKGSQEDIEKIVLDTYKNGNGHICKAPYYPAVDNIYCDDNYLIQNYSFYIEGNELVFFVGVRNGAAKDQKWISTFRINIDENRGLFTEKFLATFNLDGEV